MTRSKYCIYILLLLCIPGCEKEEKPRLPEVTLSPASNLDLYSATLTATIENEGSSKVFAFGFLYGESASSLEKKIVCNTIDNNTFSTTIIGLKSVTTYTFKAFAVNSTGISYSIALALKTKEPSKPVVQTFPASSITSNSAIFSGNVLSENGDSIISKGFCWSTSSQPKLTNGQVVTVRSSGAFETIVTGLSPKTQYYVTAYATNNKGTSYGEIFDFSTSPSQPGVKTLEVRIDRWSLATCSMEYTNEQKPDIVKCGICWSTVNIPTINDTTSSATYPSMTNRFSFSLYVKPNRRYIVRAFATTNAGTVYGDTITFTSWLNKPGPRIVDADGNVYSTVKIGKQVWMTENLRTTRYRNGDVIGTTPTATADIQADIDPKYQWPARHDEARTEELGRWYTWYAATDARGICPTGWHVPNTVDWSELHNFLSSESNYKISEKSEIHWYTGFKGNNLSGFTARALPLRQPDGIFLDSKMDAYWWTNSEVNDIDSKSFYVTQTSPSFSSPSSKIDKKSGLAIRCVKD